MPRNSALAVRRCTGRWQDTASVPIKIRPHIGTSLAAGPAQKPGLNIGQPGIIGPRIAAHGDQVAALVVGAVDQQPAHAAVAHLGKADLLRAVRHHDILPPN